MIYIVFDFIADPQVVGVFDNEEAAKARLSKYPRGYMDSFILNN